MTGRDDLRRPLPLAYHPLFSIAIVTAGDGWAEGDFGQQPVRKGQTFAWPACLSLRLRAGREPVRVVRCLGPAA
jgi:hypothetical protein